jgi:antitoxin ParD1/3/4
MIISMSLQRQEYVRAKVASGKYNCASEVIEHGLRLLEEQDILSQIRLEALKKELQLGIDSIEHGESIEISSNEEMDDFFADINRRSREDAIEELKKDKAEIEKRLAQLQAS